MASGRAVGAAVGAGRAGNSRGGSRGEGAPIAQAVVRVRASPGLSVVSHVGWLQPGGEAPFAFGRVAAARALGALWAIGARPLLAHELCSFPEDIPSRVLGQVRAGAASAASEAGVRLEVSDSVGRGHPRYGLAVTGVLTSCKALSPSGALPGDVLVLTKPLGSGFAAEAVEAGGAPRALVRLLTAQRGELNQRAAQVFAGGRFLVHALTGVEGRGLLGHALELARASGVRVELRLEQLPLMSGVPALAESGSAPAEACANLEAVRRGVRLPGGLPRSIALVLADAQTNGGLLAAVPASALGRALAALGRRGVGAWAIGRCMRGSPRVDVV